ncbi:hypothetical protein [Streptomyces sp. NPDC057686]|uniref:hypothetical protein n=1 Tax=Streptomyces sp. NPDC057686 TaxID=3346212 RepID=UPI00369007FD
MRLPADNKLRGIFPMISPTEAMQLEILSVLETSNETLEEDLGPNQAEFIRQRLCTLDLERAGWLVDAIVRAKTIAILREGL